MPRRHAYTLVELVVVLAITAAIAAIALPRYAEAGRNFRVTQAAARISADLALARWTAKSTSAAGVTVAFDLTANAYTIPGVSGTSGPTTAYTVSLGTDPYGATLVSTTFNGTTAVTFDRYGQPSTGGTVVIAVGSAQKTVTLDPDSGLTTIQ